MNDLHGIAEPSVQSRGWVAGRLLPALKDLLFPPTCPFCRTDQADQGLCVECRQALVTRHDFLCAICACPLPVPLRHDRSGCVRCRLQRWPFDRVIALGTYDGALRDAVLRTKHALEHPLAFELGRLLGRQLRESAVGHMPDILLPVPMYWYRRFRRGINSVLVLAEGVARETGARLVPHGIECRRRTRKQSMLSAPVRIENVREAFGLYLPRCCEGQHVAIVDDTMTTGATVSELARLVHAAGAREVTIVVTARAVTEYAPARPRA